MSKSDTIDVPMRVIHHLQDVVAELEKLVSPYRPEFLARMYRARASDLEGRGKRLSAIKLRFQKPQG